MTPRVNTHTHTRTLGEEAPSLLGSPTVPTFLLRLKREALPQHPERRWEGPLMGSSNIKTPSLVISLWQLIATVTSFGFYPDAASFFKAVSLGCSVRFPTDKQANIKELMGCLNMQQHGPDCWMDFT